MGFLGDRRMVGIRIHIWQDKDQCLIGASDRIRLWVPSSFCVTGGGGRISVKFAHSYVKYSGKYSPNPHDTVCQWGREERWLRNRGEM